MGKYYPPQFLEKQFHCIHCGVFSVQTWGEFFYRDVSSNSLIRRSELRFSVCLHCLKWSYWYDGRMIVPCEAPVPPAHQSLYNKLPEVARKAIEKRDNPSTI
jgi:hypothetical protein